MKKLLVAFAILSLVAVGTAQAVWTTIASNVYTDYTVQGTGYNGTFHYMGNTKSAALATFALSINQVNYPGTAWLTNHRYYCADLSEWVAPSNRWYYWTDDNVGVSGIQGTVAGNRRAADILNRWDFSISSGIQRAGMQLAVWEAIYDDGASLNLGVGNFWVSSLTGSAQDNADILAAASTYYSGSTNNGVGIYALDQQNLLRGVPEPGTLVLLGIGFMASGLAKIRRRRS